MRVQLHQNPKNPEGFTVHFPYNKEDVAYIKNVLGVTWDPKLKCWVSEGPEILLDFNRFGIEIEWMSASARTVAETFRQQLWDTIDTRILPTGDDLFAYQQQGRDFLSIMPKAILGDDRGVGKSKQSLDAAGKIQAQRILILCTPKTITYNWPQEVRKWQPHYSVGVVPDDKYGNKKQIGRNAFWKNPPDVVVANYEKLRLSDWPFDHEWDVVICDELTRAAKHATTQVHKALKRVFRRARHVWPLTGSLLEKNVQELYNIFSLLRPAVFGSFSRFRDQHLVTNWDGEITGTKNIDLLRDRIAPFIMRRTKKEVLHWLPEKLIDLQFVKMSEAEEETYRSMTSSFNPKIGVQLEKEDNTLVQMLRMRQFCCTPKLFTDELGRGSKFEKLVDIIDDWDGKVVIFCFFEEVISLLHEWLGCHPEAMISGKIPARIRIDRINAFNENKLGKVLVSTDAGNAGVNITGANLIIHYDQIFNNQNMEQRADRLHRIGQEDNVTVMHLMCMDTIDFGIFQLNKQEAALFEEVVDGAEVAILKKLDAPRLKKLVEGKLD